jgi:hypothetical protein
MTIIILFFFSRKTDYVAVPQFSVTAHFTHIVLGCAVKLFKAVNISAVVCDE